MSQIEATYIGHTGDDLRTSNSARVSFNKKRSEFLRKGDSRIRPTGRSDEELIYDLARDGHFAPFGHNYVVVHVKAPIFVARQLVKHKFLRWSEISRRYVDDRPEFYTPTEWRGRNDDIKQGSAGVIELSLFRNNCINSAASAVYKLYTELLEDGVAPEMARMVLPLATMTQWVWSGSLDAFASFYRLRHAPDSQYESRIVADQIGEIIEYLFPVSWLALVNSKP